MVTRDNVNYYPYPTADDQWVTYDLNRYNSYASAVKHSKEARLPRVVVKTWNETTQQDVYSKTYW
jgi:hypothetical protein